jgi:hypothetical protein
MHVATHVDHQSVCVSDFGPRIWEERRKCDNGISNKNQSPMDPEKLLAILSIRSRLTSGGEQVFNKECSHHLFVIYATIDSLNSIGLYPCHNSLRLMDHALAM